MMKKILLYLAILLVTLFTASCGSEQSQILFNNHPFTSETMTSSTNVFAPLDKIYYLITLPQPIETKRMLIQIVKVSGADGQRLGYNLVWGKNIKLKDEQKYYYTDYVVFNATGTYIMKVYSKDNPTKILTTAEFYVKN